MKVLLVGNYVPDGQKSMRFFSEMIEKGLSEMGHEVRMITPPEYFGALKPFLPRPAFKWLAYVDKILLFPRQLRKAASWADVVHVCDIANAPHVKHIRSKPNIVSCHDLIGMRSALGEVPEHRAGWTGRVYQGVILSGLERSNHVVCGTQATKDDILRMTKVKPENVSIVPYGLNYPFSPMGEGEATRRLKSLGLDAKQPFIIHVGVDVWYKNRMGLLSIFDCLLKIQETSSLDLVVVGAPLSAEMKRFMAEKGVECRVHELVEVDGEGLRALYSAAKALVFPSFYEGFGWPIIEAQACGCPVFASNRPPMTEVGGEGAFYFDPEDPEGASALIAGKINDCAELRKAGFENARRFSAERMVDSYVKLYGRVCSK